MGRGRMRRGTDLGFVGSRNKSEESREGAAGLGKDFARSGRGRKGRIHEQAAMDGREEGFAHCGMGRRRQSSACAADLSPREIARRIASRRLGGRRFSASWCVRDERRESVRLNFLCTFSFLLVG